MTPRRDISEMARFESIFAYVRRIPAGKVLSYGEVGRAVGETARTVGWAMSGCPNDVPWHRVVGADGALRTARRSPETYAEQKARLLAEGVEFDNAGRVVEGSFLTVES
ncbi:MAG: MGMT family protein [Capsulimonadales bacterium]|nr:MGMT family protein [Capsulimonadales bacterium]